MKRIDKYLRSISITYSNEHRDKVKDLVNKVYVPVKKESPSPFRILNYSLAGAFSLLLVIGISFYSFRFFSSGGSVAVNHETDFSMVDTESDDMDISDKRKDFEKELEVAEDRKVERTRLEEKTMESYDMVYDHVEEMDEPVIVESSSPDLYAMSHSDDGSALTTGRRSAFLSNRYTERIESQKITTSNNDEISHSPSMRKKTRNRTLQEQSFSSKEEGDMLEQYDSMRKTDNAYNNAYRQNQYVETQNRIFNSRQATGDFISSESYNTVVLYPNAATSGFFKIQSDSKTIIRDASDPVHPEEIVNYFGSSSGPLSGEQLQIEGTFDIEQVSIFMISIVPQVEMINPKLTVSFTESVKKYQLVGYELSDSPGKETSEETVENRLKQHDTPVILFKVDMDFNADSFGSAELTWEEPTTRSERVIRQEIVSSQVKNLENTSPVFRNALLGYMVADHVQKQSYSPVEITEYKDNFVDTVDRESEAEIEILLDTLEQNME
jgi:hypothetical protein